MSAKIHVHNSSSMIGREICFLFWGFGVLGALKSYFWDAFWGFGGSFFRTRVTAGVRNPQNPKTPNSPNLSINPQIDMVAFKDGIFSDYHLHSN